MVEQNMMTITDLFDDLLGIISNKVLEIKRDRAAKTIAHSRLEGFFSGIWQGAV